MKMGRQKGFRLHSYTNCISCNGDFTMIDYCCKGLCKVCYNSLYRKNHTPQEYDRLNYLSRQHTNLLTKDECIKWISKQYDNRFYTDMKGLSDLIHVYDSLGGSQQDLDEMKPGKQLQKMFDFCWEKFIEAYPNYKMDFI